jgi:uncharacterized membrane protein HdeD (DUF308 family)
MPEMMSWPNTAWLAIAALIGLFTLVASIDKTLTLSKKQEWNGWAAVFHFVFTCLAGVSFIFGQTETTDTHSLYFYLTPTAFWINLVMLVAHLSITMVYQRVINQATRKRTVR